MIKENKREDTDIKNERDDITSNARDNKRIRDYDEQLYANKSTT